MELVSPVIVSENGDLFNKYIKKYSNAPDVEKKTKASSSRTRLVLSYVDETDFIIDNNSKTNPCRLIFCPSKKSYIYVDSKGSHDLAKAVGYIEIDLMRSSDIVKINNRLIGDLYNNDIQSLKSVVSKPILRNLLERGWLSFRNSVTAIDPDYVNIATMHEEYTDWLCKNTAFLSSMRFNSSFVAMVRHILDKCGEDMAKYFAVSYNKSSITLQSCPNNHFDISELNPKRLIDYILFESYTAGYRTFNLSNYSSYLRRIGEIHDIFHGELDIFTKYPKNLGESSTRLSCITSDFSYVNDRIAHLENNGEYSNKKYLASCRDTHSLAIMYKKGIYLYMYNYVCTIYDREKDDVVYVIYSSHSGREGIITGDFDENDPDFIDAVTNIKRICYK